MENFFYQLCDTLGACNLNVIGLLLGFIGALLVTLFGLPPLGVLNQGMYVEIEVTRRMRIYIWLSRLGLALVSLGFLFQLIPAVRHQ